MVAAAASAALPELPEDASAGGTEPGTLIYADAQVRPAVDACTTVKARECNVTASKASTIYFSLLPHCVYDEVYAGGFYNIPL